MVNRPLYQGLGADVVINYQQTTVSDYVTQYTQDKGFAVVFDTVGGNNLANCFQAAGLHGAVITLSATESYDLKPAFLKGLSLHMIMQPLSLITGLRREHYGKILTQIAELVDQGKLKPLIDPNQFTFEHIADAHQHLENKNAVGKIAVTIAEK